uniref:SCP domain-containing protein n=1 Tax=Strongyloides venezuelensis TaxID=75913 RepID=A0A0K0FJB1_STRVS
MKFLLNIELYIILPIIFLSIQGSKSRASQNLFSLCIRKPHSSFKENYKVTYYFYKYKILYECNGFFFKRHKDVVVYHKKLLTGKFKNIKPEGAEDCKSMDLYEPIFKITESKYSDMIKSNPFSDTICKLVWCSCGYRCFLPNNFRILKRGFVAEMNEYRRIHDALPLTVDSKLEKLANEQAEMSCLLNNPDSFKKKRNIGYLGMIYQAKVANFVVTKMYDTFINYYNWNAKYHVGSHVKYAQIIWKSTKNVGVGVHAKGIHVCVALLFSPRGCTKNFKANVRPIDPRHFHMYALLRKKFSL